MSADPVVEFGPFRLDRTQKLLFRDGEAVALTPKAFDMLDLLVRNAGRVVEKEPLMRGVWPDTFVDEANVAHHVFMLRRALGDDREGNRFIETVPRRGYRFAVPAVAVTVDEVVDERIIIHEEDVSEPQPRRAAAQRLLIPLLALVTIASLAALFLLRPRQARTNPLRVSLEPPPATRFLQVPIAETLAVSPDGRQIAMIALEGQRQRLFVRPFDSLIARPIAGSEDAMGPFWSPDSKWIGFFAAGFMKKVPLDGGPAQTICPAQGGMGSWHANGQIVFFEWGSASESVRLAHESGGAVRDVTDEKKGWGLWPSFLADGKHFIYFWLRPQKSGIYVGSIDGGEPQLVSPVRSRGEVRGDNLYYVREGVLVRQKFDLKKFTTIGDPSPIADSIFSFTALGTANFSLSDDAAVIAWQRRALPTQLVWRDWNGHELARIGKPELYGIFNLSPDGQRIATDIAEATTEVPSIWVFDVARGAGTRVAWNGVTATAPIWMPAGDALLIGVFNPDLPTKPPHLARLNLADGSIHDIRRFDEGPALSNAVTSDGLRVIRSLNRGRFSEIDIVSSTGDSAPKSLESSPDYDASDAALSPDNRWLAYQSSESGRPEIYVRPFDRNGEKVRVSTAGGSEPRWSVDGGALLFLSPEGMLMKATLSFGNSIRVSNETVLFPISSAGMMAMAPLGQSHYAVTRDRILTREIPGGVDLDPVTVLFAGN